MDEFLYLISRDVPTRGELQILRAELASRLDRIDSSVTALLSRPSERREP